MDPVIRSALIRSAEDLVKEHMRAYDPSHDWFHGESLPRSVPRVEWTRY